jgi:phenol 2-monooxygenase
LRFRADGEDQDALIDVRAILQQDRHDLALEGLPDLLKPRKGRFGLIDYEKVFTPDLKNGRDIFDLRGIDRKSGCIVVVRPDQYVAHVLPIDADGELSAFFDAFMRPAD